MRRFLNPMRLLPGAVLALVLWSCASMGRPEGGPRDVDPPLFVRSTPSPGQLNVDRNKITIEFDENVQIKDAMSKVVISPAQNIMPQISAMGRRVVVELRDTMKPNTTYSIEFSDAISDLNEGNEIDGFSFAFSTGDVIDSLQISGMVLEASTLEPAQGMLVGVYSNLSDTAITTLPMERITKTNQLGQFTVRNLAPGTYRIFAVNDQNRDYHWDRSEDVAFYDVTVTPTSSRVMHTDTLEASDGTDSIVEHEVTRFGPNDVLLTWFNENYKAQYLSKYERPERHRIVLNMGAPSDTLPELTIVGGPFAGRELRSLSRLNASATLDTLEYWLTDTALIALDSLEIATRYLRTDTLDELSWTTDTLRFNFRSPKKKEEKKKKKKDEEADSVPAIEFLQFMKTGGNSQELNRPLVFTAQQPILDIDQRGVHLEVLDDTLWIPVEPPVIARPDTMRQLLFTGEYEWEPGAKYRLTIDSLAITNIYGLWNKPIVQEFLVKKPSDYSTVKFNITGLDSIPAMVELLNTSDKPVASAPVNGNTAELRFINPGTYYARLYTDANGNGIYDTGSLLDSVQPEATYYYNKKIPLKKNWDAVVNWDVNELPVDRQKPLEIKKNKPKPKAGELPEQREEDEEQDEGYIAPGTLNDGTRTNRNSMGNGRLRTVGDPMRL